MGEGGAGGQNKLGLSTVREGAEMVDDAVERAAVLIDGS